MDLSFILKTGIGSDCDLISLNEKMEAAGFICYTPAGRCKK